MFKLFVLQIIAPIPIVLYMNPKQKTILTNYISYLSKTYLDLFLNEYESAGTRRNYNGTISAMLNAINKDINNITKIDLVEYKNTFKNLAASTQAQKIICIKSYFKFLFDNDVIESNPAEKLSTPRVEHKPKDALTTDEAIMLMHYGNKRERAIIATFLNTGIRVQELIDIKFVDYIMNDDNQRKLTSLSLFSTKHLKLYTEQTYSNMEQALSSCFVPNIFYQ